MPMLLELRRRHKALKAQGRNVDMTRGKPCAAQLGLSEPMLRITETVTNGIDCRNYGPLEGLPEARVLFAEYLGVKFDEILVGGNSSLALMHDVIVQACLRKLPGAFLPWSQFTLVGEKPAMLCPVPGYDRHFAICEKYGIDMVSVPMNDAGPDMDVVKELVKNPDVVGMFCVPKYSNPTGITYSEGVVRRLAWLKTDPGFRIIWDLAYAVHDLTETTDYLPNMLELCREAGHEDRVIMFGSTSKVTWAGAGVAMMAASARNLAWFKEGLSVQTIGPDKLSQLRHVRFLKDMQGVWELMVKHREILKPKFDAVDAVLRQHLSGMNSVSWTVPRGGYFITLYIPGCAKRVVALAAEAGVKLTEAGATHPYRNDPDDSVIRIAPTYVESRDLSEATEVVALCTQIAVLERAAA